MAKCKNTGKEISNNWMGCCHNYPDCSMGNNKNKPCGCVIGCLEGDDFKHEDEIKGEDL